MSTPASGKLRPGDRIAGTSYVVVEAVGEGGFGIVYKVQHETILKLAAAKIGKPLPGPRDKAKLALSKALEAAKLLAQMKHPHLPEVYDAGILEGDPPRLWSIMELLKGEEVADVLRREGKLDVDRALRYAEAVADAVGAVATRGIVHRDLKPQNLFLTEDDKLLVLDFDCARLPGALTVAGTGGLMGTPYYMSPEHWRGDVDTRTDVWALAVILYQMVSGRLPFRGANIKEVGAAVIHQTPPSLEQEVGPDVWALIERGLRKNREERYADMNDFAAAIQQLRQERGTAEYVPTLRLSADSFPTPQPLSGATVAAAPGFMPSPSASGTERGFAAVAPPTRAGASTGLMVAAGAATAILTAVVVVVIATPGEDEKADPAASTSASASATATAVAETSPPPSSSDATAEPTARPLAADDPPPSAQPSSLPPSPPPPIVPAPRPVVPVQPVPRPPPPPPPGKVKWN